MKFEVVNRFGKTVMNCSEWKYVPDKHTLQSMYENDYRFKLDGKSITVKQAKELKAERE